MSITQKTIGDLQSYCVIPNTVESVVILLHGYGANGQDLISLADEWAPQCPNTLFISPDAPQPCEAGGMGYQWFSLADYSRDTMIGLIRDAWTIADKYCDAVLKEFNITDDRLIISGFSQGCMMSLHTAFSRDKACAGVLGYSGMLLDHDIIKNTQHTSIPVQLIHGTHDPVIPVAAWDDAINTLNDKGIKTSGHKTEGLPHGIDMDGIQSGLRFIQSILYQ